MALELTIPDPQDEGQLKTYARIVFFAFDFASETARIVLNCYRSRTARDKGKPPAQQLSITITKEGQPEEVDSDGNVVRPALPSFREVVTSQGAIYDQMKTVLYNFVKAHPEVAQLNPVDIQD